jgi:NCAIR mutase (PurE)-related protein
MLTLKFQRIQRTVLTCLGRRTHLGTSIKDIRSSFSTKGDVESIATILNRVKDGDLSVEGAESQLQQIALQKTNESDLQSFANLDHKRAWRTGFPEAVFASGKTAQQVCAILDDMALNVNNLVGKEKSNTDSGVVHIAHKAILATRVDQQLYEAIMKIPLKYGTIKYHEMAKIISVKASGEANSDITPEHKHGKVVVACAGMT